MPAALRLAFFLAFMVALDCWAQTTIDDRPKVMEKKPQTESELRRHEADLLLRHAQTLYGVAVIRQRHDKLIQAVETLEKAAGIDADSLEIRRMLIPIYTMLGREESALRLCREVLDREPTDAETAYQCSKLLTSSGRPAEAIAVLQKAVNSKHVQERPERWLTMLSDLADLLDKKGDIPALAATQEKIIAVVEKHREELLFGNGLQRVDLESSLARAYERLGRARVQTKELDKATAAFRGARAALLKSDDPDARHQAVRISWNLSEMAAARERWAEALESLDAYLEHAPGEIEPYEKKVEWLRKLRRDAEVLPALKRYAEREPYHLGLQLLLARETARQPAGRKDAERMYLALLEKYIKPEIYRELFHLYLAQDRLGKVLDLVDGAFQKADPDKAETPADEREAAQERARVMLQVLRSDPKLVAALLPEALTELRDEKKRAERTLFLLASLAARTHQLKEAEQFFRQCLANAPANQEIAVYSGLFQVLHLQRKFDAVIALCRDVLDGRRALRFQANQFFHMQLASALTELAKYDEALVHADKAISLSSEEFKARELRHKADILARAKRFDTAVKVCEDTMKEFPQQGRVREVRLTLSTIYTLQGEHAKSEEQLRLVLESDPDSALANNNLGYQMADRNINLEEAERLIRRAIEVDRASRREAGEESDNAAYLDSLGWVLFRRGSLSEARQWLEKAAALPEGAEDPTVWDHLGDTYARLGKKDKTVEAWQRAADLFGQVGRGKDDVRRRDVEKKLQTLK